MNLYILTMTEAGKQRSPRYEVNGAILVKAGDAQQARRLASKVVIDEPADTWDKRDWSYVRRIGYSTQPGRAKVIMCDSNAS